MKTSSGSLRFISAYLRPSIPDITQAFSYDVLPLLSPLTTIGIDSNAKNQLWNSKKCDTRGLALEQIIADEDLTIVNKPLEELQFHPSRTSFIDITLCGSKISPRTWYYPHQPSISNHPLIYFEILQPIPNSRLRTRPNLIPHISSVNLNTMRSTLLSHPFISEFNSNPPMLISTVDIDTNLRNLTLAITKAAISAKSANQPDVVPSKLSWWTKALWTARHKTKTAYKNWAKCNTSANRTIYSRAKSEYQKQIRRAKNATWLNLNKANRVGSDTLSAIKTLAGKHEKITIPRTVFINGSLTSDAVILKQCAKQFLPQEDISTDPHLATVNLVTQELSSDCQPPHSALISLIELATATADLNFNSAAGPDGIPMSIISTILPVIKSILVHCLNRCIQLTYFPLSWKTSNIQIIGKHNKQDFTTLANFRPIIWSTTLPKSSKRCYNSGCKICPYSKAGSAPANMAFARESPLKQPLTN